MINEFVKRILSSIILLPIFLFMIIEGSFYFLVLLFFCFLISLYEWQKMKTSKLIKFSGVIFLLFSFYTILKVRMIFENNYWPFLIVTFICISTDIGGYTFGKIFKGPKLTTLSPNKTYAGVLGSFLICLLLYFVILSFNLINKDYYVNFLIFTLVISSISQIGDISVSYFKRLSKIKDTGNIIPGHGGMLDRIDGMIFAFPMSYIFLTTDYFKIII